ncbi:MAG: hypothetical protein B7Z18_04100, partial [Alishewanella sp. 32-51-5]
MKLWFSTIIAAFSLNVQAAPLALDKDLAYNLVESLTVEVGPRLAGSEADLRSVVWAEQHFKQLGFDKVWREP